MNEHRSTTGRRPGISLPHQEGDVGDFLKVFACTAVMVQPLLAQLVRLSTGPTQLGLAILDNLVKYTAPAFIFGILYTTIRTHSGAGVFNYRHYLRQQWAALFWPTIYWTSAYLLLLPKLQQEQHYHNWTSFAWQFVNGNAAPQLWYNTMMLQFIILMPCFWALHRLVGKRPQRGWVVAIGTALITLAWLALYQHLVGPNPGHWYLLDRVWVSFLIYAVGGILLVNFRRPLLNVLLRFWLQATVFTLASLAWMIVQMGGEWANLSVVSYYKLSATLYALGVISLVTIWWVVNQFGQWRGNLRIMHGVATYAYRAYLGNVFWQTLLWDWWGRQLATTHLWLALALLWPATWLLAFGFAYLLHLIWGRRPVKQK